jgi:hypothetical protein
VKPHPAAAQQGYSSKHSAPGRELPLTTFH